MMLAAFSAFTAIASSSSTALREDVRAVAILLYSGMAHISGQYHVTHECHPEILKDDVSEIDLAGPTFPALKTLLDLPISSGPDSVERYQKLIHGLLSSCLLHIDEMRYVICLL